MRKFGKYSYLLLIVLLASLWIGELTQRRAFEAARNYVDPFESLAPYSYTLFSVFGIHRPSGKLTGPGWLVCYGHSTFMPTVAVSVFGNVQGSNFGPLDDVVEFSSDDRHKKMKQWVDAKQTELAEQSTAPLPRAPAGHSEGAR